MMEHPIRCTADEVLAFLDGRRTQIRRPVKPQPPAGTHELGMSDCRECFRDFPGETRDWKSPFGVPGDMLVVQECWKIVDIDGGGDGYGIVYRADGKHGDVYWPSVPISYRCQYGTSRDTLRTVWRPSIHMPRWASRITRPVIWTWAERLQDISDDDAAAEGLSELSPGRIKRPVTNGVTAAVAALGLCLALPTSRQRFLATCGSARFAGLAGWLAGNGTFPKSLTCRQTFALLWDSIYAAKGLGWDANPWVFAAEVLDAKENERDA